MRILEDALALFDLLSQGPQRPIDFGDVASGLGSADDFARGRPDRGDAQRNLDAVAVLVHARRFVLMDPLALADPVEDAADLGAPLLRDDEVDMPPDGLFRGIAEQALCGPVPGGDNAIERLADDGIVG